MSKLPQILLVLALVATGCAKPPAETADSTSETSQTASPAATAEETTTPAATPTAEPPKPETKPAEEKPAESKPADAPKTGESKPAEMPKSAEAKKADDKPAEAKPAESKSDDAKAAAAATPAEEGWIVLFDGTSLDGWEANENPETWKLEDGKLIAHGPRSHLFYVGPVNGGKFKDFELKVEVMTEEGSNSGIYFHTEQEPTGWPSKGYEVQINNTHRDPKKTGGLYAVQDNFEAPVKDGEWFTQHIIVRGNHVQVFVDGKQIVDYTQEENPERPANMAGRLIGEGTFALQGHDPNSIVYFRKIAVKPLESK